MAHQYGYPLIAFTVVTAQPTEDADFPKERISDDEFPLREAHSTALADQYYVLDFGAALASGTYNIIVNNANFTSLQLAHGDSATYNDASFVSSTSHTLAQDLETGRYKGIFSKTLSKRYLRIYIPNQTPVDDAAYLALAGVFVCTAMTEFTQNPDPPMATDIDQEMIGEAVIRSDPWVELSLAWSNRSGAIITELKTFNLIPPDQRFIYYLNEGNTQEVYLVRRLPSRRHQRQSADVHDYQSITLREWIGPLFR